MVSFNLKQVEEKIEELIKSGFNQISLKPIRDRQEEELNQIIQAKTRKILSEKKSNLINGPLFFAGSVDFMVRMENEHKSYYILETNGGSSRGFSSLLLSDWKEAINGYLSGLDFCDPKIPVVLIAHPKNDLLFYEKLFLAESFLDLFNRQNVKNEIKTYTVNEVARIKEKDRPILVMGDYNQVIDSLSVENGILYLHNLKIDYLIGDGAARRHPEFSKYIAQNIPDTVIANSNYHITDDKALTYMAVAECQDELAEFGIVPIKYWRANNYNDFVDSTQVALKDYSEVIVKPHGGSGGAGIDVITKKNEIENKINSSIKQYHEKFGPGRNPYPYTICERVRATPVDWRSNKHLFDIRVYIARSGNSILPVGALSRIALEPFSGALSRKIFVVNLSGYEGVDTSRGLGVSPQSLEILNLTEDDFVNMFSAACVLMANITNNYQSYRKYFTME